MTLLCRVKWFARSFVGLVVSFQVGEYPQVRPPGDRRPSSAVRGHTGMIVGKSVLVGGLGQTVEGGVDDDDEGECGLALP
jgi:hypothetical protein